jgi:hypothetical protein
MPKTLPEIEAEVRALVDTVRDDPQGRIRLRETFYKTYGEVAGWPEGYGISELDFLRWEVQRGVLDPVTGSPWWRNVNLDFIYSSQLAGRLQELAMDPSGLAVPVQAWLEYFRKPSATTWYRAHNCSIVQGYLDYPNAAAKETAAEQTFLNIVLYRLLFAEYMEEGGGHLLGAIGRLLANPLSPSIDILVHVPDFYPDHYPLTPSEIRDVMHRSLSSEGLLEAFFDEVIILPQLTHLYQKAAGWLQQPALTTFVRDGQPIYPARRAAAG